MTRATTLPRCPVCGSEVREDLPPSPAGFPSCPRPWCGVEFLPGEPGLLKVRTFRLVNHYSLCVLPFAFLEGDEPTQAFERLRTSGRWTPRTFSLDNPEDVDRTEYFLPYVRRFLFPHLFARPDSDSKPTQGEPTCQHFEFDLARLGLPVRDGLPLTLFCRDSRKDLTFDYKLLLEKAELIVFSYRIGFLVLRFRCADPSATYFDQMNSLSYLRPFAPLYRGFEMPELAFGEARYKMSQLLPYLLAEFAPAAPLPLNPTAVPEKTPLPVKPTYDDRMMVYTFSCLDKDTALVDPDKSLNLLGRYTIVNFDKEPIPKRQLDQREEDSKLWQRFRWEGFSKDGGSLVVFNTDRFHERFLGVYNATYYFDIFLLATFQRVNLLTLFENLSDIEGLTAASRRSHKRLRRLRRDLLLFKNQCWFSQITNRERGLVLWKKWQKVYETRTVLKEVNEQAVELDNYMQGRMRRQIEWLVRLGGFLAVIVPTILGLDRFLGNEPWVKDLRLILMIVLIVGSGLFAGFMFFRRGEDA